MATMQIGLFAVAGTVLIAAGTVVWRRGRGEAAHLLTIGNVISRFAIFAGGKHYGLFAPLYAPDSVA